jgi:hypothetical protein
MKRDFKIRGRFKMKKFFLCTQEQPVLKKLRSKKKFNLDNTLICLVYFPLLTSEQNARRYFDPAQHRTEMYKTNRRALPTEHQSHIKGTVQRDLFGWKWYQSTDLSQKDWRRDFQLILTAHSRVRGSLSFSATSYEPLDCQGGVNIRSAV